MCVRFWPKSERNREWWRKSFSFESGVGQIKTDQSIHAGKWRECQGRALLVSGSASSDNRHACSLMRLLDLFRLPLKSSSTLFRCERKVNSKLKQRRIETFKEARPHVKDDWKAVNGQTKVKVTGLRISLFFFLSFSFEFFLYFMQIEWVICCTLDDDDDDLRVVRTQTL